MNLHWTLDLLLAFLLLGFTEAVIKPIATRFVRRRILGVAPHIFGVLDPIMPELVGTLDGPQLERYVRKKLEELTGEDWQTENLDALFQMYDPRKAASTKRAE